MKYITKHQSLIILVLITLLGGVLRFWNLGNMPPSLNWDEASHGYNAYSILKTSLDEWGVHFPLIFRAFGDYKLPVYIYTSIFPIWLFGLNAFAVRFVSAFAGTLAIPGIFLLTKQLFSRHRKSQSAEAISASGIASSLASRNDNPALFAAFLLALSPWHFFISRPALEANLSLTLIIFGFYYLLKFLEKEASLVPASILLGLALHTYNTARVFVPLILIASFIIYRRHRKSQSADSPACRQAGISASGIASSTTSRNDMLGVTILILSFSLVAFQIFSGEATARYSKLQILSESTVFQIGEARTNSNLPFILSKFVYNRPVYFLKIFTKNYLNYFSPQFFLQSSGSQSQFAIPQKSLLTTPVFLLCLYGLYLALREAKNRNMQFLLAWLFLSPVASALTIDPPQALRPNPMIPALIILASMALLQLPKLLKYFALLFITLIFLLYLQSYFGEYKLSYSQSWQYGYPQVINFVNQHASEYSKIFVTKRSGEPHIFYAFYSQLDPTKLQPGAGNLRFKKSDWFWTDKIDNVYFVNDWDIPTTTTDNLKLESGEVVPTKNSLLVTSPDHIPVNAHIIETINYLDGIPAFIITSIP